jgi:hypothetical protein
MPTEYTPKLFEFEAVERRAVVAGFDGREPHRRAVRALRRSRVLRHHVGQPAAHVVPGNGLRARRHLAPRRPAPYSVRRCRGRDHPPQALEARRSGAHQRAPHSLRSRIRLPEQGRVRARISLSPARLQFRLNLTRSRKPETASPSVEARPRGLALRETVRSGTRVPRTPPQSTPILFCMLFRPRKTDRRRPRSAG